jgi:hypothetical protein
LRSQGRLVRILSECITSWEATVRRRRFVAFALVLSVVLACCTTVLCADKQVGEVVPQQYTDPDYEKGILRKEGKRGTLPGPGIFLLFWDKKEPMPFRTGDILVFAKAGAATVMDISTVQGPTMLNLFISVNKPLDPAADGFPNPVKIVHTR